MKPISTWERGLSSKVASSSASTKRARQSDATTLDQKKRIFFFIPMLRVSLIQSIWLEQLTYISYLLLYFYIKCTYILSFIFAWRHTIYHATYHSIFFSIVASRNLVFGSEIQADSDKDKANCQKYCNFLNKTSLKCNLLYVYS